MLNLKSNNLTDTRFGLGGLSKLFFILVMVFVCASPLLLIGQNTAPAPVEGVDYHLPNIDLSNWKVTLPISRPKDGKAQEVSPPDVLNYAENEMVKPYMYNDSTDASIVFYATPGATTTNTKYSRSELREQIKPGKNNINWTFAQGGSMKGKLAVAEVSKNKTSKKYEYDRVIVMQIHGRLSDEQKDLINAKDNNAPPVLKIYWIDGKIRVKTKYLKDKKSSDIALLSKYAWGDDEGYTFNKTVGNDPFMLEVKVTEGRMEIILNGKEKAVYKGKDMEKWGVFENYFKAGNYLQAKNADAFAKVKYYELEVSH